MHKILLTAISALAGSTVIVPTAASSSANAAITEDRPATVPSIPAAELRLDAPTGLDERDSAGTNDDHPGQTDRTVTSVGLQPTVVVHGASVEEHGRVDDALARFEAAGLLLPDLEVVFADDVDECSGHDGLFRDRVDPWQVLVCSDLAFVVTHELAHAWEAANLDDDDRAHYTERRGLTTWNSPDVGWGERAVEDMAFMLQQNLMAGDVAPSWDRWSERTDAYAWATGRPSPVIAPNGEWDAAPQPRAA
jgi:hypothetical protein